MKTSDAEVDQGSQSTSKEPGRRASEESKKTKKRAGTQNKPATKKEKAIDKAAFVEKLVRKMAAKLEKSDVKPSLGDFIRLLQLEKELEDEIPRSIEVKWVEPEKTDN